MIISFSKFLTSLSKDLDGTVPDRSPGLQGRGKVIAVDHPVVTEKDSPFDTILKLPNIAWPVVLHEHVNGGG